MDETIKLLTSIWCWRCSEDFNDFPSRRFSGWRFVKRAEDATELVRHLRDRFENLPHRLAVHPRDRYSSLFKSCFTLYDGAFLSAKGIDLGFKICVNLNNNFVDKIRENRVWQFLHMDENE